VAVELPFFFKLFFQLYVIAYMISNPVVLFDGICHLCNGTIDFLIRKDLRNHFRYVTLQSEAGEKLKKKLNIPADTDSVILIYQGRVFLESEAVLKIAALLPYPWKLAGIFRIIPQKLRDCIYSMVAKNRYNWFGKRKKCRTMGTGSNRLFPGPKELKL
jgi:predicted DCC family thiol-disulfide oxidoreductase YuxK